MEALLMLAAASLLTSLDSVDAILVSAIYAVGCISGVYIGRGRAREAWLVRAALENLIESTANHGHSGRLPLCKICQATVEACRVLED